MKSSVTNQPGLTRTGWSRHSIHTCRIMVGGVALLLLGLTATSRGQGTAPSAQFRPIEDFIDAQGTLDFVPPEFHATGWSDRKTVRFALVDCMGLANKWIEEKSGGAISLGTETAGEVLERPLPDGRAEVTVMLHTRNALTWVAEFVPENAPPVGQPLFGHFAEEILAGAAPALGEAFFKWVFINEAPGAPLPDLLAEIILEPTVETIIISITAHADGPLREASGVPDGTPGRAQITQIGPVFPPGLDATLTAGKWPTEHINLKVVGR